MKRGGFKTEVQQQFNELNLLGGRHQHPPAGAPHCGPPAAREH
jgi:hypothetical protein